MSLNRTEQNLFDYVLGHAEERQHWEAKVRQMAKDGATAGRRMAIAAMLADDLWRNYSERCTVVAALRDADPRGSGQRISMLNLAEYLMRTWGPSWPIHSGGRSRRALRRTDE